MADTAARNGSISPLESGKPQKVVFRNINNRYFYSFCVVNPLINGVLSQSYITWYRAIWARGRVGKRPRWVDFSRRDFMRELCVLNDARVELSPFSSVAGSCVWAGGKPGVLLEYFMSISLCVLAPSWIETWIRRYATFHYLLLWTLFTFSAYVVINKTTWRESLSCRISR